MNLFATILREEVGIDVPDDMDVTISSPFRRDDNPSFRVYAPKDDGDFGNAYDFGRGKYYDPIIFIQELYGYSREDAINYIQSSYGVSMGGGIRPKDDGLSSIIKNISNFNDGDVDPNYLETAIVKYVRGERYTLSKLIPDVIYL